MKRWIANQATLIRRAPQPMTPRFIHSHSTYLFWQFINCQISVEFVSLFSLTAYVRHRTYFFITYNWCWDTLWTPIIIWNWDFGDIKVCHVFSLLVKTSLSASSANSDWGLYCRFSHMRCISQHDRTSISFRALTKLRNVLCVMTIIPWDFLPHSLSIHIIHDMI